MAGAGDMMDPCGACRARVSDWISAGFPPSAEHHTPLTPNPHAHTPWEGSIGISRSMPSYRRGPFPARAPASTHSSNGRFPVGSTRTSLRMRRSQPPHACQSRPEMGPGLVTQSAASAPSSATRPGHLLPRRFARRSGDELDRNAGPDACRHFRGHHAIEGPGAHPTGLRREWILPRADTLVWAVRCLAESTQPPGWVRWRRFIRRQAWGLSCKGRDSWALMSWQSSHCLRSS